jgi:SAM-dependent methyltransferase
MNPTAKVFHDFEHQGWQNAAAQYGPGFGGVTIQAVEPLLEAVGAKPGMRLLDVACGPGYAAVLAHRRGCVPVGIDFSSSMIASARDANPSLDFREGDAENLEFEEASFDAVVMNFGMLHLADPDRAIAEAHRVLRPSGRFAFTVWDAPPKTAAFDIVLSAVRKFGNMDVPLPEGPPFFRFSDPVECARSLAAAGFSNVRSIVVPQVWVVESAEMLVNTMRRAAVRTAALLRLQTDSAASAIEQEIARRVEAFRQGDQIELPMPAVLTSGEK